MTWWAFGTVPELPAEEVLQLVTEKPDEIQIVDVRTEGEFVNGHIKGALHCSIVPPWSFQHRLEQLQLDKDKMIIPICLTAHRSIPAQKILSQMGFNAKQLRGGMKAWRKAKLPEATEDDGKSSSRTEEGESEGQENATEEKDEQEKKSEEEEKGHTTTKEENSD